MILPFSTQLNGKPTYFVESIWEGLLRNVFDEDKEYQEYLRLHKKKFGIYWDWFPEDHKRLEYPKIHTIREDKKNRWKSGNEIHFYINNRSKKAFQFAPVIPVVSIQEFEINYVPTGKYLDFRPIVFIDKIFFYHDLITSDNSKMLQLAQNDGFDTIEDFFAYFNEDFKGKIIHWTDFKY